MRNAAIITPAGRPLITPASRPLISVRLAVAIRHINEAITELTTYDGTTTHSLAAIYDTIRSHTTMVDKATAIEALELMVQLGQIRTNGTTYTR